MSENSTEHAIKYDFWIDRGGTFTDFVARERKTGRIIVDKLLSSAHAPIAGIRKILRLDAKAPLSPCRVRMGTTIATNALLERKGTSCALIITQGFADLLEIGTQTRPDLFALNVEKPDTLYAAVIEVAVRCDAKGRATNELDRTTLCEQLSELRKQGIDSLAIAIIHAYANPEPELELARIAESIGFSHIALSHQVSNEQGLLGRTETTVLDAYLTPTLRRYTKMLEQELGEASSLELMKSSGGLTGADQIRGPDAVLSGPAGGVVACAKLSQKLGIERAIGFDMGGTSTDVSHFAGQLERNYEHEIAGVRIFSPMLSIHTVAAGGGSICRYDGRRLSVGPGSVGADPGPLCYGSPEASELSITDLNLVLGRLPPDCFPFPLDEGRPAEVLSRLAARVLEPAEGHGPEQLAAGFLQVANANMAEAIRQVSIRKGYDLRDHALIVFGGAGGQHACALARMLDLPLVVFHPLAGVFSALGIGLSESTWDGQADAGRVLLDDASLQALAGRFEALIEEGKTALKAQGADPRALASNSRIDLRYRGTDSCLTLPLLPAKRLRQAFEERHRELYGYCRSDRPIELLVMRVELSTCSANIELSLPSAARAGAPMRHTRLWADGGWHEGVPLYRREALAEGQHIAGPALVLESTGTLVIEPGFEAVTENGILCARPLKRSRESAVRSKPGSSAIVLSDAGLETPDPVLLEVLSNGFMSIAEQMGQVLRRTAVSTNIRERLDFSCAVFDEHARLVANAPHIPVHLGAMSESVRAVVAAHPDLMPGDVYATNDPALGGSHLPDVTVVTPVFDEHEKLVFYVACRGHHADIGGIAPGSMPPHSTSLEEEGIVFHAARIVRKGVFAHGFVFDLLTSGPYPARNPADNMADLESQIGANQLGVKLLQELVKEQGRDVVIAYMGHVQCAAADAVAEQILLLPDGEHRFTHYMDDATPIAVCLRVQDRRMHIDFSGTGKEHPGNLNAPRAVTVAAVIYFLRTLVQRPMLLNSGCLNPITLNIPNPSLLSPSPGRAVAGGNVETSQRIVDVLLAAAGRAAASQGTMNNLTFGNERFGYYETIAGGAGAGPDFAGAHAVHTHMTNTRITDPEVLESRYPVMVREFSIRRNSGGRGLYPGGDGVCRELQFLEPVTVSLLSERREFAPFGLCGGHAGALGRTFINGKQMAGRFTCQVAANSVVRIETPGGGGFGKG